MALQPHVYSGDGGVCVRQVGTVHHVSSNVGNGRVAHLCQALAKPIFQIAEQQQQDDFPAFRESKSQLAIQAMKATRQYSRRRAAKTYNVP